TVQVPSTSTAPTVSKEYAGGFQALDYLQNDHPAVEAVGFDQETAKALGIGYAPKGLMRGLVAVPVRLEDGTLAGYIGITEAKLPPKFHSSEQRGDPPIHRRYSFLRFDLNELRVAR